MSSNNLANNHSGNKKVIEPLPEDQAVGMLRNKIASLYANEPDAQEELEEVEAKETKKSKHQKFMANLGSSGKSLAEIQTAWHKYYVELPDNEKHEVWQEFYSEHNRNKNPHVQTSTAIPHQSHSHKQQHHSEHTKPDTRSSSDIKSAIVNKTKRKPSKKAHLHSLLFGLGVGTLAIAFLLFGFFNERFVAPFISPSKDVSNTPIIINPTSSKVGPEAKIIIPKINVEIPVVYDQPSTAEKDIQNSLEDGVVHYSTTPLPGEIGNSVIFGHSSNNILNKGKYKFAFVLLKQLEPGDTFYLHKDGVRYVYRVGDKTIVKPTDVSVLYKKTEKSTVTLVTCDPPGTSLNRLLVTGEQISPDPVKNIASTTSVDSSQQPDIIPSNAPSLWNRLRSWISS